MNIESLYEFTLSKKILYVFLLVSLVPILLLAYFSSTYAESIIEKEVHKNLTKQAKSYGLFTFERLKSLDQQLLRISELSDSSIPSNIISDFISLKIVAINSLDTEDIGKKEKTRLSYKQLDSGRVMFNFEIIHQDKLGNNHLLSGNIFLDSLFSPDSNNPYAEPICIFTETGGVIFCSENVSIPKYKIKDVRSLANKSRLFEYGFRESTYQIAAWELFTRSHFQSENWQFVIVREQSELLATIKKFHNIILPLAMLFFLCIAYAFFIFLKKLMSPLDKLSKATKDISAGNFDVCLDINTNDELEDLGNSFTLMADSLTFQKSKDEVFSDFEKSVLIYPGIHEAIKENIFHIAKLFESSWIVISIVDPLNDNLMHTHCCLTNENRENCSYFYFKHGDINFRNISNDLYSLSNTEFRNNFQSLPSAYTSDVVWCKKLLLRDECIGECFLSTKQSMALTHLTTLTIIEFSERFSTIYTTHEQRAKLYYKAHYDSLTNLPNRSYLLDALNRKWPEARKNNTKLDIAFIDLDNFKAVNDLSGHKAGNKVLSEVAERIKQNVTENSLFARLSGDEFCILHETPCDSNDIEVISENILVQMKKPFEINDMSFYLGASIGIALGPGTCKTPESLLERADLAMYKAKQEGKNRYIVYDKKIEEERSYRLSLEHYLHSALEFNEIQLNFQPKIDLDSGKMTSVECLARWHQRDIGFVPTENFILLAEESGMITEIGAWILRKACYQFVDWKNKDIPLESIAVNVSARQLISRNFTEFVSSVIEETGIPPHCLDLEITESAFINDESLLTNELEKIHELGVKISIDDFGKEYSSLSYLKKIPFDTLKIDREFIIDLETDHRDQHIIDVIINIGHTLNKKIVAEGIETINQRNILKKYGCDIGQGYLFSRPLTDIEFLEFAAKYNQVGMQTDILKAITL